MEYSGRMHGLAGGRKRWISFLIIFAACSTLAMAFLIFPLRAVEFIPPVLVHTFLSFTPFYLSFLACHLPIAAKAQLYIFSSSLRHTTFAFIFLSFFGKTLFLSWILWDEKGRGERGGEKGMGWEEIYDQAHARVRFEAGLEFGCLGAKGWDGAGWPLSCYYYSYNYYSATTSTD